MQAALLEACLWTNSPTAAKPEGGENYAGLMRRCAGVSYIDWTAGEAVWLAPPIRSCGGSYMPAWAHRFHGN